MTYSTALFLAALLLRKKFGTNKIQLLAFSLFIFIFIIYTAIYYIADNFTGHGINEAVVYHLEYGLSGAGFKEYLKLIIAGVILLLFSILAASGFYLKNIKKQADNTSLMPILAIVLIIPVFILHPASHDLWRLYSTNSQTNTDFWAFYKKPEIIKISEKSKNFIYIYAEGLERSFFDETVFPGLIKDLRHYEQNNIGFSNLGHAWGSGWTIAGMVSSQCGIPLTTFSHGNSMSGMPDFLPEAVCLSDLLHTQNYYLSYMGGASIDFAGKGKFYQTHHFDQVRGKDELLPFLNEPDYLSGWGLYDDTLLELAYEEFIQLSKNKEKFGLFLLTLDTHQPDGHPSKSCNKTAYQDGNSSFLNAVACSDYLLSRFIKKIQQSQYADNTIIFLMSDHLSMKNQAYTSLKTLARKNLFMIIDGEVEHKRMINKKGTTLDIAATSLSALGFEGYIGLSRNLLGKSESLMSQFDNFNSVLAGWKQTLLTFWGLPQIEGIKINFEKQYAEFSDKKYQFPLLMTFNEKLQMEKIIFEFYSEKKLTKYLPQLAINDNFIWIDSCEKMPESILQENISNVTNIQWCILAGKPGAPITLISSADKTVEMTKPALTALSSLSTSPEDYKQYHRYFPDETALLALLIEEYLLKFKEVKTIETFEKWESAFFSQCRQISPLKEVEMQKKWQDGLRSKYLSKINNIQ